jgi:DNA-binding transcriptional LysR family regulator
MNLIDRLQIFVRVAELNSFRQTADDFGIPKASVSTAVKQLEAEIGTRLFHRTTRKVALTHDGHAFYSRSTDLLAEIDDAKTMFHQKTGILRGRVRIDMSTAFARYAVIPKLPQLIAMHPLLEFEVSSTERFVDLVREGFDCVLRGGVVTDTGLIARPVGHMRMVNCASPAYLSARGIPETPADLSDHHLVHFVNSLGGKSGGFEYVQGSNELRVPMGGAMTVNNADAYSASCLAGLGIIQVPYVGVRNLLATGQLTEVLQQYTPSPMPLSLIYANRRNLSRRVRVVMDWLAGVITDYLAETTSGVR